MAALIDQIPWWVYPLILSGGGLAAIVLIPGVLPLALGIWNALPNWLRLTIIEIGTVGLAILYGRNQGARHAREQQAKRDAVAVNNRRTIDHEVQNLDRPTADKRLSGWMRD